MFISFIIIVIGVCALIPVLAACLERRMIWPYSEPQEVNEWDIADTYIKQHISTAKILGFQMLGRSHDLKGAAYKVDYYFLVSSNRDTLAIIGTGTVMKMTVQGVWLYSIGPDDTAIYSVNNQACIEFDVSGKWKSQLVFDASFESLYRAHRAWLEKTNAVVTPFREGREHYDFRHARGSRIELMIRKGLAKHTQANPEYWKYSLVGAFRCGLGGYFVGLFRALKAGRH